MHALIERNREIARAELSETLVDFEPLESASVMTVMWLNIKRTGFSDLELTDYLGSYNVAVLPGRYFFWNSHDMAGHHFIRIALMKPDEQFKNSISRLKLALTDLEHSKIPPTERLVEIQL
jgi:aspartate/methionine/tyrosine aminotransferase